MPFERSGSLYAAGRAVAVRYIGGGAAGGLGEAEGMAGHVWRVLGWSARVGGGSCRADAGADGGRRRDDEVCDVRLQAAGGRIGVLRGPPGGVSGVWRGAGDLVAGGSAEATAAVGDGLRSGGAGIGR